MRYLVTFLTFLIFSPSILASAAVSSPPIDLREEKGMVYASNQCLLVQLPRSTAAMVNLTFDQVSLLIGQRVMEADTKVSALPQMESDKWHITSSIRLVLGMYARHGLKVSNSPLRVRPYILDEEVRSVNAFYDHNDKSLGFYIYPRHNESVFACTSLDVVAHETGHWVLDLLRPDFLRTPASTQKRALHETFGDLTALFLRAFYNIDGSADLTSSNCLASDIGECVRQPSNALTVDNFNLLLPCSPHNVSNVLTGAIYDAFRTVIGENKANAGDLVASSFIYAYFEAYRSAPIDGVSSTTIATLMVEHATSPSVRKALADSFTQKKILHHNGDQTFQINSAASTLCDVPELPQTVAAFLLHQGSGGVALHQLSGAASAYIGDAKAAVLSGSAPAQAQPVVHSSAKKKGGTVLFNAFASATSVTHDVHPAVARSPAKKKASVVVHTNVDLASVALYSPVKLRTLITNIAQAGVSEQSLADFFGKSRTPIRKLLGKRAGGVENEQYYWKRFMKNIDDSCRILGIERASLAF